MNPTVISSAHGKIRRLLVAYNGEKQILSFILNLTSQLPAYTQILIWACSAEVLREVEIALSEKNISYYFHQTGNLPSNYNQRCYLVAGTGKYCGDVYGSPGSRIWVRDPFIILQQGDKPICIEEEGDDGRMPYLFEDIERVGLVKRANNKKLLFDGGGDILIGDDFLLIGRWSFTLNKIRLRISADIMVQSYIGAVIGIHRVIPIGTKACEGVNKNRVEINNDWVQGSMSLCTPLPHIDQYISLAGRRSDGKYVLLVAEAVPKSWDDEFMTEAIILNMKSLNKDFDGIVQDLKLNGFIIIRNSMPILEYGKYGLYNNCLVEIYENEKRVWLPVFGQEDRELEKFDYQNILLWESLGFHVIPVPGLLAYSNKENGGALHCMTNEFSRE